MPRITNATERDAGVYACLIGTREAHVKSVAHLNVVEDPEHIATFVASTAAAKSTKRLAVIAASVSLVAAVLLVLCLYIFIKCRQERHKKRQAIKVRKSAVYSLLEGVTLVGSKVGSRLDFNQ